jgi:hypothetical protein
MSMSQFKLKRTYYYLPESITGDPNYILGYKAGKQLSTLIEGQQLTQQQINQLFTSAEAEMKAGGQNRTWVGKGGDAIGAVSKAISGAADKLADTTPGRFVDSIWKYVREFAVNVSKDTTAGDAIIKKIDQYQKFCKEHPNTYSFFKTVIPVLIGLGTGGAGAAGWIAATRAIDGALQGHSATKMARGAVAGAAANWAGGKINQLAHGAADLYNQGADAFGAGAPAAPNPANTGGASELGGAPAQPWGGQGIQASPDQFMPGGVNLPDTNIQPPPAAPPSTGMTGQDNPEINGPEGTGGGKIPPAAAPTAPAAPTPELTPAQELQIKNLSPEEVTKWYADHNMSPPATPGGYATQLPGGVRESIAAFTVVALPLNEMIDRATTVRRWTLKESLGRPYSKSVILTNEGVGAILWNLARFNPKLLEDASTGTPPPQRKPGLGSKIAGGVEKTLGGIKKFAGNVWNDVANKTTLSRLQQLWTDSGRPTDSDELYSVLTKGKVTPEIIAKVYQGLGVPLPANAVPAPTAASPSSRYQSAGLPKGTAPAVAPKTIPTLTQRPGADAATPAPGPTTASGKTDDTSDLPPNEVKPYKQIKKIMDPMNRRDQEKVYDKLGRRFGLKEMKADFGGMLWDKMQRTK